MLNVVFFLAGILLGGGITLAFCHFLRQATKGVPLTEHQAVVTAHAIASAKNELLEQQLKALKETMDTMNKTAKMEFEQLATKMLDVNCKKLSETNHADLYQILNPLKEKLTEFSKSVEEKYSSEAKERHTLQAKIEELMRFGDRMTNETTALTKALRGDPKIQGNWGELTLERILEASGLRKGEEYVAQGSYLGTEGDRYQPDFVIHLPDGKHLVVDAKVSLKHYTLSLSTEDPEAKKQLLGDHLKSIKKHIEELSDKHYAKLKELHSPEVVFMFIPVEPAYFVAAQEDSDLFARALKNKIMIVTATTLVASLKTVSHIWMMDRQNKNAQKIAEEAGKVYDKFCGFVEEFQKIGKVFDDGQRSFKIAMDRLKDGQGNVFKKLEDLRELGVSPKKQLPIEYL